MLIFFRSPICIIVTLIFFVLLSYNAFAVENNDIKDRAEKFALYEANLVLEKAKNCSTEAQFIKFLKDEIKNTVAVNYMALWVLGNNKSKFTPLQFDRFTLAFQKHITEFYGSLLYQSKEKSFNLKAVKSIGINRAIAEFKVPYQKQELTIEWHIRLDPKANKLLITDFIVNGISFLQTKRTEYNAFFKKSGYDPEVFINSFNENKKTVVQNFMSK